MAADLGSFVFGAVLGIAGGFLMAAEIEKRGGVSQLVPAGNGYIASRAKSDSRDEKKWLARAERLGRGYGVERVKFLMPGECIGTSGLVTNGDSVNGYWHGAVPSKLPWCRDRDGEA